MASTTPAGSPVAPPSAGQTPAVRPPPADRFSQITVKLNKEALLAVRSAQQYSDFLRQFDDKELTIGNLEQLRRGIYVMVKDPKTSRFVRESHAEMVDVGRPMVGSDPEDPDFSSVEVAVDWKSTQQLNEGALDYGSDNGRNMMFANYTYYVPAILGQVSNGSFDAGEGIEAGAPAKPCEHCKNGKGPFRRCRQVRTNGGKLRWRGACANCVFNGLHMQNKSNAKGKRTCSHVGAEREEAGPSFQGAGLF